MDNPKANYFRDSTPEVLLKYGICSRVRVYLCLNDGVVFENLGTT